MARTSANPRIVNRTVRAKLEKRADPHWHLIAEGQHLGYRKTGEMQGSWIARYYTREHGRRFQAVGMADDTAPANGTHVLSFQQALEACQVWFATLARADNAGVKIGPYKVKDAADDWLQNQNGCSKASLQTSKGHIDNHILPTLGDIEVARLTRQQVEQWLHHVATKPPLWTTFKNAKAKFDPTDPEIKRQRRDTANRIYNTLSALLTHAYKNEKVASKAAWETVPKFENVAVAKNEYLTLEEAKRFMACCPQDFRDLVQAALITGCRYGELCSLKVSAYDASLKSISLIQAKTGKPKHIFLTKEETAFFKKRMKGKSKNDFMLLREDGEPWGNSNQRERMKDALKAAKIKRHVRFHDLRHTFATLLVMNGTSIQLVANQLGHSGTRIAEKHYAHFSPSYVAATIRENKPDFLPTNS